MKWIRYRHLFLFGTGEWNYEPLFVDFIEPISFYGKILQIEKNYSWFYKYNGLEYYIEEDSDIPIFVIDSFLQKYESDIVVFTNRSKNLKNIIASRLNTRDSDNYFSL